MIEYYMHKAKKAQAEFLDKVILGQYPGLLLGVYLPIFSPFQLESYYVCDHASRRLLAKE